MTEQLTTGSKMLLTGASGFLGSNILPFLREDFDRVVTLGRSPANDIRADLAKEVPAFDEHFDIVLHCAGKAHTVPRTEQEKKEFFEVNEQGTVNLCLGLEKSGVPAALVYISTVAVYGCSYGEGIDETHPLNADTPYAQSKLNAEKYLEEWCAKHNVVLTILRPSLIFGKNAPGNLGAMAKGIRKGYYFDIAGGKAVKSIVMAEDIARLIPLVKNKGGVYNVCDSESPSFGTISRLIAAGMGKRKPLSVPMVLARLMARAGDLSGERFPLNSARLSKITSTLTFSNKKAVETLGWKPIRVVERIPGFRYFTDFL